MIKNHLQELELSGVILMFIGVVLAFTLGMGYGGWVCGTGMLVLLIPVVYKAFHWERYAAENKRNIIITLCTIATLLFQMLRIIKLNN